MSAMMTLQQVAQWVAGGQLVGDGGVAVQRVHTDTRSLQDGDLFVALKGERFDANDFLVEARAKGAVAAICHDAAALRAAGLPGVVVADSKLALGQLAAGWRAQFKLPLIAVTGSNGKTTVTQMIAAILRAYRPQAMLATEGNLNNEIGVPLTVLRLRPGHELAVVELGMNHPGEIAVLAAIAQPTVALVNNAQREHQEFMATIEAVARENGAVIEALAASGTAVFPADDTYSALWHDLSGARPQLTFALTPDTAAADLTCAAPQWTNNAWQIQAHTPAGLLAYTLQVAGLHNVKNSLAAAACALAAGVPLADIARGLEDFEPVKGRSRALAVELAGRAITLVDDSYNANPDSVRAAIDVLADLPGPRLLVLGDMGEVGSEGPRFHAEVGAYARERGVEMLFGLGEQAAVSVQHFSQPSVRGCHFTDIETLNTAVLSTLPDLRSVLVKGSRFMRMERVVQAITASVQQNKEHIHAA